uniref:Uncharacterized protein n=1 Tax=Parascaris univalens TaxID=6257 RepID=A0A915AD89_PARUN
VWLPIKGSVFADGRAMLRSSPGESSFPYSIKHVSKSSKELGTFRRWSSSRFLEIGGEYMTIKCAKL